jgi:PhnB protein
MAVKPIPEGYHTVTPYLIIGGANKVIEFLKRTFDAKELERMETPDGRVMHAEIIVGDSRIMVGEPGGNYQAMPAGLYVYVSDVDAVYRKAIEAGGTSLSEPADQFYGDRNGGVKDPAGNIWWIATHKEDVAPEEMRRRMQAAMAKRQSG